MDADRILEAIIRLETKMDTVGERMNDHGKRIKAVERVAVIASVFWGGICVVGYVAKDAAAAWIKQKASGNH